MDGSSDPSPTGSQSWRDADLVAAATAEAVALRVADRQRRLRASLAVSASITVVWLLAVSTTGLWGRVTEHWIASLTMVFGSLVAGATPQGGGAVAFPVFTKGLQVSAEAARTFSLCIQSVGMGTAAVSIMINRRPVEWRAAVVGAVVGSVSFVVALLVLGDPGAAFWPMELPGPYVKVTFTLVLIAMAWVVLLGSRVPIRAVSDSLPAMNKRLRSALVLAGVLGGLASALVGSGIDVMVYLFVVVLFGVRPSVGVPTSVLAMAAVSVTGFVVLGLIDGQLQTDFGAQGSVLAVGGDPLGTAQSARRADIFGMWIASVPVVAWGGPLGSLVAARLSPQALVRLVIGLAAAEAISTAIFLEELRSDPLLALYAIVGGITAVGGLTLLAARRRRLFGLPSLQLSTLITRSSVEVGDNYREDFR